MVWANLIFAFLNVAMAWCHARTFPVKHGLWSAYYLAAAFLATWLFTRSTILHFSPLSIDWLALVFFLTLIALRKPVFDLSLNYFRKKPRWYVSLTTGSILDRFFIKLFRIRWRYNAGLWLPDEKRVKFMYGSFSILWLLLVTIYYLING